MTFGSIHHFHRPWHLVWRNGRCWLLLGTFFFGKAARCYRERDARNHSEVDNGLGQGKATSNFRGTCRAGMGLPGHHPTSAGSRLVLSFPGGASS